MKLNNKRTCKDLSVAMNVCTLKVQPWVITISSRPGSDNKVRVDRTPSHRSKDNTVLYSNTPFRFQRSISIGNNNTCESKLILLQGRCYCRVLFYVFLFLLWPESFAIQRGYLLKEGNLIKKQSGGKKFKSVYTKITGLPCSACFKCSDN